MRIKDPGDVGVLCCKSRHSVAKSGELVFQRFLSRAVKKKEKVLASLLFLVEVVNGK